MVLLLVLLLLVLALGGLPNWGYHEYGYMPTSAATILLIVLIVLLLSGRLRL